MNNKPNAYYIHFDARSSSIGVSGKIDMQIREIGRCFDIHEIDIKLEKRSFLRILAERLPWVSRKRNYKSALESFIDPAFVYIRRTSADSGYVGLLRRIKKKYPRCKILIEIFSYPYDESDRYNLPYWLRTKELIYRRKLKKYIDRFIVYTKDEQAFGVKTIPTINGIAVRDVKPVSHKGKSTDTINLISVAYLQRTHGYERILRGMISYYTQGGKRNIIYHVVGDGPELDYYKSIVCSGSIEEHVVFCGTKVGGELDEIYDRSDIAVTVFGIWKNKTYYTSALKTRECLAKGLPLLAGCTIDVIDDSFKYCRTYPNDDSDIDMNDVIEFYDSVYNSGETREKVVANIRSFAEKTVDNSIAMKPIIDYALGQ